ncbi:MAG: hypothetical protein ABUM51_11730, partial [Bacteroidota bacterium]
MHRGRFIRVFYILAAISLLLDWYVFNGLKTLTSGWKSSPLRKWVPVGYLIGSVGITALFLLGMGSYNTSKGMTPFHEWMLSLFLTFLITKIFFTLILFLGDIGRFFYGIIHYFIKPKSRAGVQLSNQ